MRDGVPRAGQTTVTISRISELNALTSRRGFLKLMGVGGALVLLPSVLAACSDDDSLTAPQARTAVTIDFARGDVAVLQFAYALEQLEADFYTQVVNNVTGSDLTPVDQVTLGDVRNHEVIHRDLLKAVLGAEASFTLTPTYPGVNFKSRASVLATARTLEDLGVAAYNGAAQYFSATATGLAYLSLATKIVSVEARHASAIGDLINPKATDFAPRPFDDAFSLSKVATNAQGYIADVVTLANLPTTFVQGPNNNG
jgi:rubrerythrin